MQILDTVRVRAFAIHVMKLTRQKIDEPAFQRSSRAQPQFFTRQRALFFSRVLVLLLQKTVRSLQLHLHDFFRELGEGSSVVSASACTQARAKLKHSALIELNQCAILTPAYAAHSDFQP